MCGFMELCNYVVVKLWSCGCVESYMYGCVDVLMC